MKRTAYLRAALKHGVGYAYDAGTRAPFGTQDCTRYLFAILLEVCGDVVAERSGELHIRDAAKPYSNVQALIDLGLAEEASKPVKGGLYYCQGWRSLDPLQGGHAFMWLHGDKGAGFIIQATPGRPHWCEVRSWKDQAAKFPAGVELAKLTED
jgi:hypothetical protein